MLLKNKKILVAVTGSIAIYKALDLIRLYIKAGAIVKVIMTEGAKKFIELTENLTEFIPNSARAHNHA